uniref:Uncharacterized protein n=1 Tax=Rhizophora mucronata TaxID=61149 RepID=A0A2P2NR79_RHIMU
MTLRENNATNQIAGAMHEEKQVQ